MTSKTNLLFCRCSFALFMVVAGAALVFSALTPRAPKIDEMAARRMEVQNWTYHRIDFPSSQELRFTWSKDPGFDLSVKTSSQTRIWRYVADQFEPRPVAVPLAIDLMGESEDGFVGFIEDKINSKIVEVPISRRESGNSLKVIQTLSDYSRPGTVDGTPLHWTTWDGDKLNVELCSVGKRVSLGFSQLALQFSQGPDGCQVPGTTVIWDDKVKSISADGKMSETGEEYITDRLLYNRSTGELFDRMSPKVAVRRFPQPTGVSLLARGGFVFFSWKEGTLAFVTKGEGSGVRVDSLALPARRGSELRVAVWKNRQMVALKGKSGVDLWVSK